MRAQGGPAREPPRAPVRPEPLGARTAPTTPGTPGRTSRTGCRPTSASRWRRILTSPTRCTSSPSSPDTVRVAPRRSSASTGRGTPDARGRALTRGLPQRDDLRHRAAATGWPRTAWTRPSVYFRDAQRQALRLKDSGRSWHLAIDGLPSITCVRAAVIADTTRAAPRGAAREAAAGRAAVMRVAFLIPTPLRPFAEGGAGSTSRWTEACASLGEALAALGMIAPGVRDRVLTEPGRGPSPRQCLRGDESCFGGRVASPRPSPTGARSPSCRPSAAGPSISSSTRGPRP